MRIVQLIPRSCWGTSAVTLPPASLRGAGKFPPESISVDSATFHPGVPGSHLVPAASHVFLRGRVRSAAPWVDTHTCTHTQTYVHTRQVGGSWRPEGAVSRLDPQGWLSGHTAQDLTTVPHAACPCRLSAGPVGAPEGPPGWARAPAPRSPPAWPQSPVPKPPGHQAQPWERAGAELGRTESGHPSQVRLPLSAHRHPRHCQPGGVPGRGWDRGIQRSKRQQCRGLPSKPQSFTGSAPP